MALLQTTEGEIGFLATTTITPRLKKRVGREATFFSARDPAFTSTHRSVAVFISRQWQRKASTWCQRL